MTVSEPLPLLEGVPFPVSKALPVGLEIILHLLALFRIAGAEVDNDTGA